MGVFALCVCGLDRALKNDLAWLTDLTVQLFATFMGIQLIHELGLLVVAGANGVRPAFALLYKSCVTCRPYSLIAVLRVSSPFQIKTSVPTFVPSIVTGITSSVTTFSSPPKNMAAMFDFAVAGPLAGIVASLLAIVVGSKLTMVTDPSLFPALPLEVLRMSTLGGGIIEMVLGNGALYIPEGALGTSEVMGLTVPLHPIAVAGYISLIVTALAFLPVGSKYINVAHFYIFICTKMPSNASS